MTTRTLSARDRRALFLGAPCLLLLVVAFRGVPAWRAWRSDARALAMETRSQAAGLDALLAGFDEALDTLEARTARMRALGPAFLIGDTPADAGSTLSALLAELARQSLVRLDTVDLRLDTTKSRSMPVVSLEVQATADIAGMSSLVKGLEDGPTMLAVRQLTVRSPAADAPGSPVEMLSIRFTVEGLALVRARGDSL